MQHIMRSLMACLLMIAAIMPAQRGPLDRSVIAVIQQNPAALSGYIVENLTGRPIDGASVLIYTHQPPLTAKTGPDGYFRIDGIAAGDHSIDVSRSGFLSIGRSGAAQVRLRPGENRTDFILRLREAGTLSGRVLDSSGRPVVQARVSPFYLVYNSFQREPSGLGFVGETETNIEGEFRLSDISPGKYFVVARPPLFPAVPVGVVMYPGERELQHAERIEVRPHEETRLQDLRMPAALRGWVHLRIINATGAPLPARFVIGTAWAGSDPGTGGNAFVTPVERAGSSADSREFQPATFGPHVFHSRFKTAVGDVAGYAKVLYSGEDVEADLVLRRIEENVKGRVVLEAPDGTTKPLAGEEIEFFGLGVNGPTRVVSKQDGRFTIGGLLNAPFHFSAAINMPKGYYVASVREPGRDVLQMDLSVSQNSPELEVRVRVDGGSLEGTVSDGHGLARQYAMVALVPQLQLESRIDRNDTYRVDRSNESGAFQFRNVIPGEYLIFAWTDVPQGALMDPWFMEAYRGRGLPVKLDSGALLRLDVRILDE